MVASKSDAIAAIIEMNPTANPVFLSEFSKNDLEQYLDRLGRIIETDDNHHGRFHRAGRESSFDMGLDTAQSDESWW